MPQFVTLWYIKIILDDTISVNRTYICNGQKQNHVLPATKITEIENKNVQFDVKSNTCGVCECDFYALYTTLNSKSWSTTTSLTATTKKKFLQSRSPIYNMAMG